MNQAHAQTLSQALLESHIAFEMERLSAPGGLDQALAEESAAAVAWLAATPLRSVAPPELALELLERLSAPEGVPPGAEELGRDLVAAILLELQGRSEKLSAILSHDAFFFVTEDIMEDANIRRALIHAGVTSPIFALLIAEVLFNGISDFLAQGGRLASQIPGVGALIKAGQSFVGDTPEKTLKEFIKKYINQAILRSEEFLNKNLKPETIREAAEQLWIELSERGVREAIDYLPPAKLPGYSRALQQTAEALRQAPLSHRVRQLAVEFIYERLGDRPATESLALLGLDPEKLKLRLCADLRPAMQQMLSDGFLEARLRAQLRPFYESKALLGLLSAPAAGG